MPQTTPAEVVIVEQRELHPGIDEVGREPLFPDPLRQPHAPDLLTKQIFQITAVGDDLTNAVAGGNARKNWLVERAANNFHLAAFHEATHHLNIIGLFRDQPFQQAARGVQGDFQLRIVGQCLKHRPISIAVRVFEHPIEVSDRLVIVQGENQTNA